MTRVELLEEVRVEHLKRMYTELQSHKFYRESVEQYTHVDPTKLLADADKEIARLQSYIDRIESI